MECLIASVWWVKNKLSHRLGCHLSKSSSAVASIHLPQLNLKVIEMGESVTNVPPPTENAWRASNSQSFLSSTIETIWILMARRGKCGILAQLFSLSFSLSVSLVGFLVPFNRLSSWRLTKSVSSGSSRCGKSVHFPLLLGRNDQKSLANA